MQKIYSSNVKEYNASKIVNKHLGTTFLNILFFTIGMDQTCNYAQLLMINKQLISFDCVRD